MNELLEKTFLLIVNMSFTASFVIVAVLLLRILLKKHQSFFLIRYGALCCLGSLALSALKAS